MLCEVFSLCYVRFLVCVMCLFLVCVMCLFLAGEPRFARRELASLAGACLGGPRYIATTPPGGVGTGGTKPPLGTCIYSQYLHLVRCGTQQTQALPVTQQTWLGLAGFPCPGILRHLNKYTMYPEVSQYPTRFENPKGVFGSRVWIEPEKLGRAPADFSGGEQAVSLVNPCVCTAC